MATLEQLGFVPPMTDELNLFDYVGLDDPRQPPSVELRARLIRRYEDDEEEDREGLRLAFVAGHSIDRHDLLVIAYLWRAATRSVVWGSERWPSPERRLRPYWHDPTFEPRAAGAVHAELQSLGADSFGEYVRGLRAP